MSDEAGGRLSFSNPKVSEPFIRTALETAELKPPYLALATEVNLLALSDPGEFAAFAAVYRRLYPRIKQVSPDTQVFVTFQWEAMRERNYSSRQAKPPSLQ